MARSSRSIDELRNFVPFLQMIENGLTPDEIKANSIELLKPAFLNPEVLQKLPLNVLLVESTNVARNIADPWAKRHFIYCIEMHRAAFNRDSQLTLDSCATTQREMQPALSKFWSMFQLERKKKDLEIEEYAMESFKDIGILIESVMRPFLKGFLAVTRICESGTIGELENRHLGRLVTELNQSSHIEDLVRPAPWGVPLNQWRNMAQHQSFHTTEDQVICWYGQDKKRELSLSREDLLEVSRRLFRIFSVIRASHILFVYDNWEEMAKRNPPQFEREDQKMFDLATMIASQGFQVVDLGENEQEAWVVVRDCSNMDPETRRFHASQFAYTLWVYKRKPISRVEYREKDDTLSLCMTAKEEDCAAIYAGKAPLSFLAECGTFRFFKQY